MPLIIDGHNLIGADPTISLDDPQDELQLVRKLQGHSRTSRRSLVVYFDQGELSACTSLSAGLVSVRFVRPPRTADDAILAHLRRLGGEARNWTIVTSDRQLQAAARELGARVLQSEDFALEMNSSGPSPGESEKPEMLSSDEIAEWEELFRRGGDDHE